MTDSRLLYASDLHGSNVCFLKLISFAVDRHPTAVLIGGDFSGKLLVPVARVNGNQYVFKGEDNNDQLVSEEQFRHLRKAWGDKGIYYHIIDRESFDNLTAQKKDGFYQLAVAKRLHQWLDYAAEQLESQGIPLFVIPGNDDPYCIENCLASSSWAVNVDGVLSKIEGFLLYGIGYSTPTPYDTYRELSEGGFSDRLRDLHRLLNVVDFERLILLSHVPPSGIGLAIAPKVFRDKDGEFRVIRGSEHDVGSRELRAFIDKYQPLLVLSGHCHDSAGFQYLGQSLCANVGSSFSHGVLHIGVIVLNSRKVLGYQRLTI